MTTVEVDRSYRALLAVPVIGRLLLGMQIARIAQSMMNVAIVLFALNAYRSAPIAGLASFCGIFPGLLVSPIAGALLDRHGRNRLVVLDYIVALGSLVALGTLALAGLLPAWLLLVIAGVASLTTPLSATGLRSVFPLIVPSHLWERMNAIDSTGYLLATLIGPPVAAAMVALWGGATAFIIIGCAYGLAAAVIARAPKLAVPGRSSQSLLIEAWEGLVYTWRNPTLRGLGFSISLCNIINGAVTIVVPLIVLQRLHLRETVVGLIFGIQGLAGIVSAVVFGRLDSRSREKMMLSLPMFATAFAAAMLLLNSSLMVLSGTMIVIGFLNGPVDIALFTLRQRRTDPEWTGRAFAVSMSFNYLGVPLGSAIAGILAARSIESAIVFGVVTCVMSGVATLLMIP
jgi:MFS family permease